MELPVFFQGERVGSYRKYDERPTVALLGKMTPGGNPALDHDGEDDWFEDEEEGESGAPTRCPSALGDEELIESLQRVSDRREK